MRTRVRQGPLSCLIVARRLGLLRCCGGRLLGQRWFARFDRDLALSPPLECSPSRLIYEPTQYSASALCIRIGYWKRMHACRNPPRLPAFPSRSLSSPVRYSLYAVKDTEGSPRVRGLLGQTCCRSGSFGADMLPCLCSSALHEGRAGAPRLVLKRADDHTVCKCEWEVNRSSQHGGLLDGDPQREASHYCCL